MTARILDTELLADLALSAWEREQAADVGGVADACGRAAAIPIVDDLTAAPLSPIEDEVSEAFDMLVEPATIRVSTDLTWSMTGAVRP